MYGWVLSSSIQTMRNRLRVVVRGVLGAAMLGVLPSCGEAQREPRTSAQSTQATQARQSRPARPPRGDSAVRTAANCVVKRVSDGDTIVCEGDQRVRLLLIDTPELSQGPYGRQAMQALQRLAPVGTTIRIETDVRFRDQYGRTLGYLWTSDGRFINEEMVAAGMAVVLVYPPNVKYVDRLRAASAEAKRKKVGLWATSGFECAPRDHRAGRC